MKNRKAQTDQKLHIYDGHTAAMNAAEVGQEEETNRDKQVHALGTVDGDSQFTFRLCAGPVNDEPETDGMPVGGKHQNNIGRITCPSCRRRAHNLPKSQVRRLRRLAAR